MNTCLPQPFVDRIQPLFLDKADDIIQSFEHKRLPSIRINILKSSKNEIETYLNAYGIHYKCVAGIPEALIVESLSTREITTLPIYTDGKIYIQSLSSMLPVRVLDPQPGESILDMAAAPGSKTTQLAAHSNNQAYITANDIDRGRIFKLKAIIQQQGAQNISITTIPGQTIWQKYPEYFDKVLLDAPCSMEGRFDCADKKSYEHWSLRKVKNLSRLQQWLLRSALSSTKVGGTIIYSTCTISPEENEGVINWLLEKEQGAVAIQEIELPGIEYMDGLTSFENRSFDAEISKSKRIVPSAYFEGFYIAKLKKLKSTIKKQDY